MRIRYPTTQNNMLDHKDPVTHQVNPGAWREAGKILEMPSHMIGGNYATQSAKLQRLYLVDYVNLEEGSVPWQDDMI